MTIYIFLWSSNFDPLVLAFIDDILNLSFVCFCHCRLTFLLFSVGYNPLLSLLDAGMSHIWPWESLHASPCVFFACSHYSLGSFLLSGSRYFRLMLPSLSHPWYHPLYWGADLDWFIVLKRYSGVKNICIYIDQELNRPNDVSKFPYCSR